MMPKRIEVKKGYLTIEWSDNTISNIKLIELRKNCPCAVCAAEKEDKGEKYIPLYTGDQLVISKIKIVGSYALGIIWKDGHNTGIYEFSSLRELSD